MKFSKILSVILVLISLTTITFANISFFGSEINSQNLENGDNLVVNSYVVNRENLVKSEIEISYELRRVEDMSLFYEKKDTYSFAAYEVKELNKSIFIGNIPSGKYFLNLNIKSGSGTPLSFLTHELTINGDSSNIIFKELPYLKIYYPYLDGRTRYELSYSNTGKPIVPGSNFEIKFSLENLNLVSKDLVLKIYSKNTYSNQEPTQIYTQPIYAASNSVTEFSIPYNLSKAGTYDFFVKIFDDDDSLIANKEVRVVIMGAAGSIIDLFNKKDIYSQGEVAQIDVSFVGPADAVSIVKDAYLEVSMLKGDIVISKDRKEISTLPYNPLTYNFLFDVNQTLDYYKVRAVLGKGDIIYDVVELNYEPLTPQLIISPDGRIYDPTILACLDDNLCTDVEKTLGNCYDCIAPKKVDKIQNDEIIFNDIQIPEKNYFKSYLIIGLVIFFVLVLVISKIFVSRRFKKNERK